MPQDNNKKNQPENIKKNKNLFYEAVSQLVTYIDDMDKKKEEDNK